MQISRQKTLKKEGALQGIGIHTGMPAAVIFKPALEDTGICFFKNKKLVGCVHQKNHSFLSGGLRCTSLGEGEDQIQTIEHLLAALSGLSISNAEVHVEGLEIPCLDGSAKPFVDLFKELGVVEQGASHESYKIKEPIFCYDKTSAISVYPSDYFRVAYILDYDYPGLRNQKVDFKVTAEIFEKEIAPARTFGTEDEAADLRRRGLGLGANFENTLVLSPQGVIQNSLRFPDECARHKVLDIVGDLNLLGFPILGRVIGLRSGHLLNRRLAAEIKKQKG